MFYFVERQLASRSAEIHETEEERAGIAAQRRKDILIEMCSPRGIAFLIGCIVVALLSFWSGW